MKTIYIIGNWKSNKTSAEANEWFTQFQTLISGFTLPEAIKIILCVPFTLLSLSGDVIEKYQLPIALGAENVSSYGEGAYTGEITARQIKEFANVVLIGHSERRKYTHETDEMLYLKATKVKESDLTAVYCVEDEKMNVPDTIDLVGFEPKAAIGTGKPMDAKEAESVCANISANTGKPVLYGGSITSESITSFIEEPHIQGVIIGKASLDPTAFFQIIRVASSMDH